MYKDPRNILIETYRKFEIFFNTEEETFHCISDYYDTEQKKKTYAATKTAIDTYIKENSSFRPFFVIDCKSYSRKSRYDFPTSHDLDKITITGIRKDNRLVAGTEQISEYDEKSYFMCIPENEPIFEELAPLIKEREAYEKMANQTLSKINEVKKKLTLVTLSEYKKTLLS